MKTNSIIVVVSTIALGLTACGGSTPEPETPEPSAEMEEEAAPEEDEAMEEGAEEAEEEAAEEGDEEGAEEGDEEESEEEGDGDEASGGKKSLRAMKGNRMEKADAEE